MLLETFLASFESMPPERYRTLGASTMGSCARRLAYGLFPEKYQGEPMTARRRARLMAGREFERVVMDRIVAQLPAHASRETAFLWPVPVDAPTFLAALDKLGQGRISGHVLPDMNPNDIPRWRRECERSGMRRLGGLVLDPTVTTIYVPALADGIADLSLMPEFAGTRYELASVEFKTQSTAGFRRSVRGLIDEGYRTQFAIELAASNLDTHVAMFYRLETSHGAQVIYSRRAESVRATWHLSNGQTFTTEAMDDEPDHEWDEVTIEHPFEPALLERAADRLRRVLLSEADELPAREPRLDFVCRCGNGSVVCSTCKGGGLTAKLRKPCGPCAGKGSRTCDRCGGHGVMPATELPFPCNGWCPFLGSCWVNERGAALYEVEMPKQAFGRPKYMITRANAAEVVR